MRLIIGPTRDTLIGEFDIPVSKYHAHRALMLASLAPGESRIRGISATRQLEWTVRVLRALGTDIRVDGDDWVVTGGPYRAADHAVLDVGSSGTTLYFILGLASLADRDVTVDGMKYFRRRPVKALLDALTEFGVHADARDDRPPVHIAAHRPRGGDVHIAGTLSQWISGLLLIAPFAEHDTTIHVTGGELNERPYVDLTLRMMRHWGLTVDASADGLTYRIPSEQTASPADYALPPDVGSAAFGVAAAALHPSDVLLRGITDFHSEVFDHPEAEFFDIARRMDVPWERDATTGFVRIRHDGVRLAPVDVDVRPIPDLLPVLSAMAATASGASTFRNVGHVRLKESDRVHAMLQLNRMGGRAEQTDSTLRIAGVERLHGAALSSFNDHRVLMSLAVAATAADGSSTLTYPHAYRVSYPEFLDEMNGVGLDLKVDPAATARRAPAGPVRGRPATTEASDRVRDPSGGPAELLTCVRAAVAENPDGRAVVEVGANGPRTTTWRELADEANRISALLLELGVERGDAVALQLPNWREFVAIALGTLQIGAVCTPIMPVFGPRESSMTLSRSAARVLFTPNLFRGRRPALELLDAVDESHAKNRPLSLEHVIVLQTEHRGSGPVVNEAPPIPADALARYDAQEFTWRYYRAALDSVTVDADAIATHRPSADDICQLLFTSGTTGEPKGVQHRHATLDEATTLHVARSGLTADDPVFVPSPLAHQTGFLYGMLLSWRLQSPCIIQPVWDARIALAQAFGMAGASFVQAATPFLTDLVRLVDHGAASPESLRLFVVTGAAVPRQLARHATTALGAAVLGAFGTTETCLGTLSSPDADPADAWGTDGTALDGIRLRIVDDDGAPVAPGVEGQFELSSPTSFAGYLDRPDLTADAFTADHWYRTGDLATIDGGGFLRITGRIKDVINRGGEKVPVAEVEGLLFAHPLIADVAVVAMPDERLGERACAFIVPTRGRLEFAGMRSYLAEAGLSRYYWPERIVFIDQLPRNAVGKVQKAVLRERARELVPQSVHDTAEPRKVEA